MLNTGDRAPSFNLPDQNGKMHSLEDFKGKKIVVYFYPKDSTPGCTLQAQNYADLSHEFSNRNTQIIGISKDSVISHKKFENKYNLPFILLSDSELSAIKAYDVWQEKKLYGKPFMGVVRSSFLIDENGVIQKVSYNVKAAEDAKDVLKSV